MSRLVNPVLRGMEPDPSIVRWGDGYLVATSTFTWSPAVRLHRSPDLVHWEVVGHAVTDASWLDLRGLPEHGGVWAPSLSVVGSELWLVLSVVRSDSTASLDLDNYLLTAPGPEGPWSAPVRVGTRGFDVSMFHDDDGRHWLTGVQWDPRPGHPPFGGIYVQEYDARARRPVGPAHLVHQADDLVEGPNLYLVDGRYVLLLAQGGTGWNHGITAARAAHVLGPYEPDPQPSVMTSRDAPGAALQKAGHGELVRTPRGEWYLVHLAGRPTWWQGERFCVTGRETCLQRVTWTPEGWLRLADDEGRALPGTAPRPTVEVPGRADGPDHAPDLVEVFDGPELDARRWSTWRRPADPSWVDVRSRPGHLRLHGGHSADSRFDQSMVATRLQEARATATAVVDVDPPGPRARAGLAIWYDSRGHHVIHVTRDDRGRRVVVAEVVTPDARTSHPARGAVPPGPVHLRADVDGGTVTLSWSSDGTGWEQVARGPARAVSDDWPGLLRFTGAFVALRAEDHDDDGLVLDVDRVEVRYPST